MLIFVVMTYRLHICDIFDEIPIMDSRDQVKYLYQLLHQYSYSIAI